MGKKHMSDGIPPKILKNSRVCCDCILNSVFDSKLKKADLTAVHKVDDTTDKKTTVTLAYLILSKDFCKNSLRTNFGLYGRSPKSLLMWLSQRF